MKAHVGVDADSGLVHSLVGTAANESDVSQAHALLHGHEELAFGDAGYIGVDKRDEMKQHKARWHVAIKRGKIKAMREGTLKDLLIAAERTKAQIRAIRVWSRIRRSCLACSAWQIWCSPRGCCWPNRGAIRPERAKRAGRRMNWRKTALNLRVFLSSRKAEVIGVCNIMHKPH
jgi:hypothetical protein